MSIRNTLSDLAKYLMTGNTRGLSATAELASCWYDVLTV